MNNIFFIPSFYAHILNGLFFLIAIIIIFKNYSKIINLDPFKLIVLTLLLSATIGIHSLSHLGLEKSYNYNPLSIILDLADVL